MCNKEYVINDEGIVGGICRLKQYLRRRLEENHEKEKGGHKRMKLS